MKLIDLEIRLTNLRAVRYRSKSIFFYYEGVNRMKQALFTHYVFIRIHEHTGNFLTKFYRVLPIPDFFLKIF